MRLRRFVLLPLLLIAAATLAHAEAPKAYPFARATATPTALDRYVAKPDPNYHWELVKTEKEDGLTSYTIDLTSQQWRTEAEVDRPIWKHWLTISVPDKIAHPTAMLFIDGGNNRNNDNPRNADGDMKRLALQTKTITATVFMVPNQPLVFADAMGWSRTEDGMIAYTWDKYFRTGDEEWPARLPMTKAAVRAMDTIQTFCASAEGGGNKVKDFVVAGGSKRGWATWTTAIVDNRVRAIVPCVIDVLNVIPNFAHHYAVFGAWSIALGDYKALRILDWLNTPENAALMKIVDPYEYRDRLTLPKLIMNAGNDQFFVPDSSKFYWDDLEGPKWIRYIPNVGHGLDREEAYASMASFYHAMVTDTPVPNYSFTLGDDGTIEVKLAPSSNGETVQPIAVKLWQAHNPKFRDFRGAAATYTESPVEAAEAGIYRAKVEAPAAGWIAYFLELTFPGPTPETPFKFTSGVRMAPDTTTVEFKPLENPPKGFLTKK
jgi:PhoPQ-activated pathogenicity-related protein